METKLTGATARHWWDPYQPLGKQSKLEVKGWGLALGNRAHLRIAKKSEKRALQITGSSGIEQRLFTLKYVAKKKRVGSDKKNVTYWGLFTFTRM